VLTLTLASAANKRWPAAFTSTRGAVRTASYFCDMPHWVSVLAIVVVGWLVVAVVGGLLVGRGLGVIERRTDRTS